MFKSGAIQLPPGPDGKSNVDNLLLPVLEHDTYLWKILYIKNGILIDTYIIKTEFLL